MHTFDWPTVNALSDCHDAIDGTCGSWGAGYPRYGPPCAEAGKYPVVIAGNLCPYKDVEEASGDCSCLQEGAVCADAEGGTEAFCVEDENQFGEGLHCEYCTSNKLNALFVGTFGM